MKKGIIFGLIFLFLSSCTQEHLILVRNWNRVKLLSLDQILTESGLKKSKQAKNSAPADAVSEETNAAPEPAPAPKKIASQNKDLLIPVNQDFSIQQSSGTNLLVIKSVQGGVSYLKEKSQPDTGLFYFHTSEKDGKIHFQLYSASGELLKNLYYYVRIKPNPKPAEPAAAVKKTPPAAESTTTASAQSSEEDNASAPVPSKADISQLIVRSIAGMPPNEAIRELNRMLDNPDFSDPDKEVIRYKVIELYLAQTSYTPALAEMEKIQNPARKALYNARYLKARKKYQESLRSYMDSLTGDDSVRRLAIPETENLILTMGTVEKDFIDKLLAETKRFKTDKAFTGTSLVQIAKIYQYLPDVYAANEQGAAAHARAGSRDLQAHRTG